MAKNKDADGAEGEGDGKKGLGGKMKLIAIILPTLLLIGGGVYFFVLAPKSDTTASASASAEGETDAEGEEGSEPTPTSTEVPGATVAVDAVTINLASGHFLQVGLLLQATKDAGEEVLPGKAADCLIKEFSGKTIEEISTEEGREEAKENLLKAIKKAYEKKVYEIYYTTFVYK